MKTLTPEQVAAMQLKGLSIERIQQLAQQKGYSMPQDRSAVDKLLDNPLTRGIQAVFPGKRVGQAIGTLAGMTKSNFEGTGDFYDLSAPKPLQVGADVASGALSVAGFGGAGTVGSLGQKVVKSAALGAGLGASTEVAQTGNVDFGTVKSALVGGAIAGAVPVVSAGISKAVNKLIVSTPKQLVNYTLKTPAKQVPKELNEAFLKRKLGGKSLQKIFDTTADEVSVLESKIQDSMRFERIANPDDVITSITTQAKKTGANITNDALKKRIQNFVPDYADLLDKPALTDSELNILRKAIDNNLKEATFLGKQLTNEQKLVKTFADKARGLVQSSTKTESLFKQQSEAIGIRNLAEQAIKKAETQGRPGLLDIASAGVGASIGGIPGAAIGIGIERAIRSPQVQGGVAQALRALQPVQNILEGLSPAARATFVATLQAILQGNVQDEKSKQ